MPTWNSRGLRGSTLEELVNLTNELYTEKNLALIPKAVRSSLHISRRIRPSTISGWYRAFRSASMQKSVRRIHFHSGTSTNTR